MTIFTTDSLDKVYKWAESISGSWNGDEAGLEEDRANQAQDIMEACENLQDLINGMDNL